MLKLLITMLIGGTALSPIAPADLHMEVGTVTSVIENNAQLSTGNGNGWYLEQRPDMPNGEQYLIVFNDMGTTDIYDDEIVYIEKLSEVKTKCMF
ncbi:MAG: hypothetical protein AB9836_04765 [Aminipila sp.]